MSVYTSVEHSDLESFLSLYDLGQLINYRGITGGITNTNYFVDTEKGSFVLTLFEDLPLEKLPVFLHLYNHLSNKGVACPAPVVQKNGAFVGVLCNKPAAFITKLSGKEVENPNEKQCYAVGRMLAKMHLAGSDFAEKIENSRDKSWFISSAKKVSGCLKDNDLTILQQELEQLNLLSSNLPSGIIHADLFRDNVLMDGNEVAGFIDFYYAVHGLFVYDLAIALNDWTRDDDKKELNQNKYQAMMSGYESVRPLTNNEKSALNNAHRVAALRFWLSRLVDFHFPTSGELTFTKNPDVFKNLLLYLRKVA